MLMFAVGITESVTGWVHPPTHKAGTPSIHLSTCAADRIEYDDLHRPLAVSSAAAAVQCSGGKQTNYIPRSIICIIILLPLQKKNKRNGTSILFHSD